MATVDVVSMLIVPIVVAITSKLVVPVAAAIAKAPKNRIVSLPTPESHEHGNRTVDRSPSRSPIGDVVVVICCMAGSQSCLPGEALGDGNGNGEALQQN